MSENSKIKLVTFFFFFLGEATVPVADCSHEHFNSHCKNNMKLNDFIEYWQKKGDAIFSVMRLRSRCCTDIGKDVNTVHSNIKRNNTQHISKLSERHPACFV